MKHGFIKVSAATPAIRVADVKNNLAECIKLALEAAEYGAKIAVFPELCLTGATAGDLFFNDRLIKASEQALGEFAAALAGQDILTFVGLPVRLSGKLYNACAAVCRGEIIAIIPKTVLSAEESRYFCAADGNFDIVFAGQETLFGSDIILACDSVEELTVGVAVGSEICAPLSPSRFAAAAGATVIANPYSAKEQIGRRAWDSDFLRSESYITRTAVIRAEAGIGESGTDGVYSGCSKIAELGNIDEVLEPYSSGLIYADIDVEYLTHERTRDTSFGGADIEDYDIVGFDLELEETQIKYPPYKLPFVPDDNVELERRCRYILEIQSNALAERIRRSSSNGAVVGVSGGLDSTLALLVAVKAMDILGMDRKSVTAVTMPCFGTTKRTKSNAEKLSEALGATLRCVDIKAAVNQHFSDIGHDSDVENTVYENAQARERTQVLMDIANASGALVVGTGDLSELALGWATYNGDHMSMYGVNAGVPKTLMRCIVSYCADNAERTGNASVAEILRDVLATPVSPELLPPKDGNIAQCTEGIVGPYELHDFFMYCHVRRGYSPEKILRLATLAFDGEYDAETITKWLNVFMRRFFSQQFKRSCLPDGPKVGTVGFSPRADLMMPSDAVGELWTV